MTPELNSTPEDILSELGFMPTDQVGSEPEVEASDSSLDPDVLADEQAALAAAAEPVVEAQPETPAPEVKPEPETPKADPKLEALIEREARIVERESAIKEFQPQLDSIQQKLNEFEAAKAAFKIDRLAYLRALDPDLDFDSLAKQLWYEKLGTAAPLEHRVSQEARTAKVEVHKLRQELEAERQRNAEENARKQAEASEAQYVDSLRGYLSSVPSELGLVQHLSKQRPDVAVRMMHDAARMIAPGLGRSPTVEEAAKAVQKYLDDIGYVAPAPVSPAPEQTKESAQQPAPTPTTIRNSHSAVQPGRVPPNENDPRVLRRNALREMAAVLGDPSIAELPVD